MFQWLKDLLRASALVSRDLAEGDYETDPATVVSKPRVKLAIITADYEHGGPGRADDEKRRLINPILEGKIKLASPDTSDYECYCDICKAMFVGSWFNHQKQVHNRVFPKNAGKPKDPRRINSYNLPVRVDPESPNRKP